MIIITDEQIDALAKIAENMRLRNAISMSDAKRIKWDVHCRKTYLKVFKRFCDEANRSIRYQQQLITHWSPQR